jgi:hypothetical protein
MRTSNVAKYSVGQRVENMGAFSIRGEIASLVADQGGASGPGWMTVAPAADPPPPTDARFSARKKKKKCGGLCGRLICKKKKKKKEREEEKGPLFARLIASAKRKQLRLKLVFLALTGGAATYEQMQEVWTICGGILLAPALPALVTHVFPMLFIYCWMWFAMCMLGLAATRVLKKVLGDAKKNAVTNSMLVLVIVAVLQSSITMASLFYDGRVTYADSLHYWWKFRDFAVWKHCWTLDIDSKLAKWHRGFWFANLF